MTEVLNNDNLTNGAPAEQILSFLVADGRIDLDDVATQMQKKRRKEVLDSHPYDIYQGSDGRWRTYVKDEENTYGRKLIVKTSREKLEDTLIKHYLEQAEDGKLQKATMASLLEDWFSYKGLHVDKSTVDRIRNDWNRFYADTPIIHRRIIDLTKLELDTWVHEMIRKHEMTPHMYTNFSLIIRQELNYAVDLGIIEKNPFLDVKVDKKRVLVPEHKKPDQTQVFSREEWEKLQELAWKDLETKHYRVHHLTPLAVMFMFYTGVRVGELCAIRYSDIQGDVLMIRRMVHHPDNKIIEHTKGAFGDRKIPLVPQAQELIHAAQEHQRKEGAPDDGYLFSMNEMPLLYTSVTKAFYRYCRLMGIDPKSSHKARKTFVSILYDNGVNINTIRQIVGHTDERTTLNNYCFDRSTDEEKMLRMTDALG